MSAAVESKKLSKEEKKAAKAAKKAAKAKKKAAKKAAKAESKSKKRKAESDSEDEVETKKAKTEEPTEEKTQPDEEEQKPAATEGKQTGTVNWFNTDKGFGFISPTDGGEDLFVHQSAIFADGFRCLNEGEEVEFDVEVNPANGKTKAVNVTGPGGVAVKGDRGNDQAAPAKKTVKKHDASAFTEGKQRGACNWFNSEKGFGFISPSDGGEDIFVHQSSLYAEGFRSLAEGEEVEFDVETNPQNGKTKAVNVTGPGGVAVQGDGGPQGGFGGGRKQRY